ncbi:hypothetical protein DL93DRAFT_2169756 [Clavulina sp. PMI_390]|nr:hypothetical protein DL93DRAFT_2169756 [Clavulina sp. PMI_390]
MSFAGAFGAPAQRPNPAPAGQQPSIFGQPAGGAPQLTLQTGTGASPFAAAGAGQSGAQAPLGQAPSAFGSWKTGSTLAPPAPAAGGLPSVNVSTPTGASSTIFSGGAAQTSGFGSSLAPPANPASSSTSSLFPPANPAPASTGFGGSLLGSNPSAQPQPSQQPFASSAFPKPFGASTTSPFGSTPAQAPAPSAFGASTLGQSTLGASALGQSSAPAAAAPPALNPNSVEAQIQAIEAAITPGSASNRFQYYFYNLVDADQVHLYGRPANATNEALWQRAVRDNPNPSRLVPALAVGFDDLKKRADAQKSQVDAQVAAIRLLKKQIDELSTKHALNILPLAQKLSHTHTQLSARLAALIHHLHLFIPSLRGASIRPEEEALRAKLEAIEGELTGRSDALGRPGGRMAELWGVIGRAKAQKEAGLLTGAGDGGGWAVVDPAAFEELKQIIVTEQQGLKFITEMLRTALRDIDNVRSGFAGLDLSNPS